MVDKAIKKITEEAMTINDPMAFAIEEYLTAKCTNTQVAMKLLAEDKSLAKIYNSIWSEARKRRKGNVAFIPPEEVYEMVDKYYGLGSGTQAPKQPKERANVLDLI